MQKRYVLKNKLTGESLLLMDDLPQTLVLPNGDHVCGVSPTNLKLGEDSDFVLESEDIPDVQRPIKSVEERLTRLEHLLQVKEN